jgi:hypothetical protein
VKQIIVALTAGDTPAPGRAWRITAKKTDFYLDSPGQAGNVVHLSAHGPSEHFDGHRSHIKVDRALAVHQRCIPTREPPPPRPAGSG